MLGAWLVALMHDMRPAIHAAPVTSYVACAAGCFRTRSWSAAWCLGAHFSSCIALTQPSVVRCAALLN